jgi:hypothetical protein
MADETKTNDGPGTNGPDPNATTNTPPDAKPETKTKAKEKEKEKTAGPTKVPVPPGMTGVLYAGEFYPADEDGEAEVPAEALPHLEAQAMRRDAREDSRLRREEELQVTVVDDAPKARRGR